MILLTKPEIADIKYRYHEFLIKWMNLNMCDDPNPHPDYIFGDILKIFNLDSFICVNNYLFTYTEHICSNTAPIAVISKLYSEITLLIDFFSHDREINEQLFMDWIFSKLEQFKPNDDIAYSTLLIQLEKLYFKYLW